MTRILIALSLAALTVLLQSVGPTSATDYSVSLGCSDGTQLTETLDASSAADLAEAVTAINGNPAGSPPLTCTLSTTPLSGNVALAAGAHDFAVGGGQWFINGSCELANFGLSSHVDASSVTGTDGVGGTFNLTIPEGHQGTCTTAPGHLKARVICLAVSGTLAEIQTIVEQSSGSLGTFLPPGSPLHVRATDNKITNMPDTLAAQPGQSPPGPCGTSSFAGTAILHGNINVRDR